VYPAISRRDVEDWSEVRWNKALLCFPSGRNFENEAKMPEVMTSGWVRSGTACREALDRALKIDQRQASGWSFLELILAANSRFGWIEV
jgi:hypothetical protein